MYNSFKLIPLPANFFVMNTSVCEVLLIMKSYIDFALDPELGASSMIQIRPFFILTKRNKKTTRCIKSLMIFPFTVSLNTFPTLILDT